MKTRTLQKVGKAALFVTGTLAAAYVGSVVAISWLLVRPSRRNRYDCVPRVPHGRISAVDLLAADGVRLHAWMFLSTIAAPTEWVILLHGYRSDRETSHRRLRFFARRGFNVFLLHFRGHGSSQPTRISYGFKERLDVQAAFAYLRSLPVAGPLRIGIDGKSMGAAAAAYAIGHGEIQPDWLILESCYDNIHHALANRMELALGSSLSPLAAWPIEQVVEQMIRLRAEDLDPAKALEKVHCPVLVLAGDSEKVLKTMEIEYLYGAIPEPKRLALFPGAGHEDLLAHDPRRYIQVVNAFLREYSLGTSPAGWRG